MGVSKVDFGGETLVDLTNDTVTQQSLLSGYSAHNKEGELIDGMVVVPAKVSELENDRKYITENGDSSYTTVEFERAERRENIQPRDSLKVAFSKISKIFSDLKTVAFSGKYTDLTDTPTSLKNPKALTFTGGATGSYDGSAEKSVAIPSVTNNLLATIAGTALDAVQGKLLSDRLAEINSNLRWRTIFYGSAQMETECVTIGDGFINCATVAIICSSGQDWCTGMFYIVAQDFPQHCDFTAPIGEGFVKIRIHAGGKSFTVLQNTAGHLVRRIYAR